MVSIPNVDRQASHSSTRSTKHSTVRWGVFSCMWGIMVRRTSTPRAMVVFSRAFSRYASDTSRECTREERVDLSTRRHVVRGTFAGRLVNVRAEIDVPGGASLASAQKMRTCNFLLLFSLGGVPERDPPVAALVNVHAHAAWVTTSTVSTAARDRPRDT